MKNAREIIEEINIAIPVQPANTKKNNTPEKVIVTPILGVVVLCLSYIMRDISFQLFSKYKKEVFGDYFDDCDISEVSSATSAVFTLEVLTLLFYMLTEHTIPDKPLNLQEGLTKSVIRGGLSALLSHHFLGGYKTPVIKLMAAAAVTEALELSITKTIL